MVNWHERLGLPTYEINESDGQNIVKYCPLQPHHLTIGDEAYDAFYRYHDTLRAFIPCQIPQDLAGNYTRFPEKALRIAALFASFGNGNSIELNHWAKAQAIAERWRIGLHELYHQVTTSTESQTTKFVKGLSIEDQITRAIGVKVMPDMREINQFTGLNKDIVEPALKKLIYDGNVQAIKKGNRTLFMLL